MLSTLIKSKTRVKLLTLFLTHPDERFYYRELFNRLEVAHASLQKELKSLVAVGLLETTKEANIRYYWMNKNFAIYPELKAIILKTVGLADFLKESLKEIGNVDVAFIYGSVAKNLEDIRSDIDLMVIGQIDMDELHGAVSKAEQSLSREINYSVFSRKDWQKQLALKKSFVVDVFKGKKIFLIGSENDLRKIA